MDFVRILHHRPSLDINILDRGAKIIINDVLLVSHGEACILGTLLEV
jgi:hypothetical protein